MTRSQQLQSSKRKESSKFWRDPNLHGLEMLRATFVTYSFSRHVHEGFGIAMVEEGAMAFEYQGATHIAPEGSVVIVHPDEVHTGYAAQETGWTYRTLLPTAEHLQQVAAELKERPAGLPYFEQPILYDRTLHHHLLTLHRVLETSESPLERESKFLWTTAHLIQNFASDRPPAQAISPEWRAVNQVRDYLLAHYMEAVSLDDLARLVNMNALRLLRVFRRQMGMPPHAYQVLLRVQQAKRLLVAGVPIADAALDTGFTDQSHLNRHFKRMVGVTPGQYAGACKNVQDVILLPRLR